jgi:hypothetical protein
VLSSDLVIRKNLFTVVLLPKNKSAVISLVGRFVINSSIYQVRIDNSLYCFYVLMIILVLVNETIYFNNFVYGENKLSNFCWIDALSTNLVLLHLVSFGRKGGTNFLKRYHSKIKRWMFTISNIYDFILIVVLSNNERVWVGI